MIILGIDPGSVKTGWAVLRQVEQKVEYINSGVVKTSSSADYLDRFGIIHNEIKNIIDQYNPDCFALEKLIFVKNPNSLMKLAQVRGIILSLMLNSSKSICKYAPTEIKLAIGGHGHANKLSIQKMLDLLTGKRNYEIDDESDALAIALCHSIQGGQKITVLQDKVEAQ